MYVSGTGWGVCVHVSAGTQGGQRWWISWSCIPAGEPYDMVLGIRLWSSVPALNLRVLFLAHPPPTLQKDRIL